MIQRFLFALSLVLVFSAMATAQPSAANKTSASNSAPAKDKKDPEADRIMKERRDNAQSLLINLAADAGRFDDQTLRARTQARIADVLWSADPDRARALFRKAWESAEVVDQEAHQKMLEDMQRQQAAGQGAVVAGPRNIRGEVLRLAAKRDRALGEEFLAKLKAGNAQDAADLSGRNRPDPTAAPEAVSQRLNLARQLLSTDVERALQFADPVLTTVSREAIDFLSYLRDANSAAADQRYLGLMAGAANNLQSDANTVSILSSYLFTPHVFVTFNDNGASTMSTAPMTGPVAGADQARAAFFRAAAGILSRPLAPPGQDQTTSGAQGKYLMLKRLLPLFEQFAPGDLTELMKGQLDALSTAVSDEARQRDDDTVREGIRPPQSSGDREKALLDRLDRAKDSDQRDDILLQLARLYVENGDLKARDYVDKIADSEVRKQARPFIDAGLVNRAIDKKDVDQALELLKTSELTHLHKSWTLIQVAKLIGKKDPEKAQAAIEEATTEARRIEEVDPDRSRALMSVANAWLVLDRSKAWDAVGDAIKAANSSEAYSGEDGMMRFALKTKTTSSIRSSSASDFDVSGIFADLAKQDYNRTVDLARGFERVAPRASATIAIARTVLEDKKN
jgi:hypothetical protein